MVEKTCKDVFSLYQAYDFTWYAANVIDLGVDGIAVVVGVRDDVLELSRIDELNSRSHKMSLSEIRYYLAKGWVNRVA